MVRKKRSLGPGFQDEVVKVSSKLGHFKKQSEEQAIPRYVHGYLTEEAFDEEIKKLKPRYMTVSIFETHPPWSYTYADRHKNVRAVQAYFLDQEQKQLGLVIYEFTGYEPTRASA